MSHRLRRYSLWLLGRRSYSTAEMRTKLERKRKQWEGEEESIDEVMAYLQEYSFINDRIYAQSVIKSLESAGKSKRVIRNKLLQKGIPSEMIDEMQFNESSEIDSIRSFIAKHPQLPSEKLIRRLLYRGFSYNDIKIALSEH